MKTVEQETHFLEERTDAFFDVANADSAIWLAMKNPDPDNVTTAIVSISDLPDKLKTLGSLDYPRKQAAYTLGRDFKTITDGFPPFTHEHWEEEVIVHATEDSLHQTGLDSRLINVLSQGNIKDGVMDLTIAVRKDYLSINNNGNQTGLSLDLSHFQGFQVATSSKERRDGVLEIAEEYIDRSGYDDTLALVGHHYKIGHSIIEAARTLIEQSSNPVPSLQL